MTIHRLRAARRSDEAGNVVVVVDGIRYFLDPAADYDDDHPAVQARADLFDTPNVESATKAPGEKRTTKRTKAKA